jgi:hypothetical protein
VLTKPRMRLMGIGSVVSISACLVLAGNAAASIVINKSIAGVSVGASMASVKHVLGTPNYNYTCAGQPPGPCGPGYGYHGGKPSSARFWTYSVRHVDVFFFHGKVQALTTTSSRERTSRGIGPGVSVAHMERVYPNGAIAPFSGAQGWWLPGAPKSNALFSVFVGSPRNNPTKLGGNISIVEIGRWLGDAYGCDFYDC